MVGEKTRQQLQKKKKNEEYKRAKEVYQAQRHKTKCPLISFGGLHVNLHRFCILKLFYERRLSKPWLKYLPIAKVGRLIPILLK